MSIDQTLRHLDKLPELFQDIHSLTSYVNDLRIVVIFLVALGLVVAAIFFLCRAIKSEQRSERKRDSGNPVTTRRYAAYDVVKAEAGGVLLSSKEDQKLKDRPTVV